MFSLWLKSDVLEVSNDSLMTVFQPLHTNLLYNAQLESKVAGRLLSSNHTFTPPPPVGLDRTWFMPRSSRFQNHSFFNKQNAACGLWVNTVLDYNGLYLSLFKGLCSLIHIICPPRTHLILVIFSHIALLKITTSLSYHKFSLLILSSITFISWKEKYGCSRSASHIYNKH